MRKSSIALLLPVVAFLSTGCFMRFPAKYSETQQFSVPLATGGTLHISTLNGAITVRSGDVKEVQIVAEKTVRSRTDEEAREFCENTKIETETQASGSTVSVVLPKNYRGRASIGARIEAIVPERCNLKLGTSNGRIEARGINGNVEMRTSNGRITGEEIGGNVFADTSNGAVRLERVSGSAEAEASNGKVTVRGAGGDIRAHTSNGGIELRNVVANAEAVTSNGSITCVLPGDASATVSGRTSNGRIRSDFPLTVKRGSVSGKIGEGKFSIELRSSNGSISLKRI
ncbi:DUF4097 family beta strand repeat protein [bacterium]|nr:DUF4097 family beta strand repeat protein [bacterium]